MFIRRANVNQRIERYGKVISTIEKEHGLFENQSPLQLSFDEQSDIVNRLEGDIYNVVRLRTPLLLRLDSVVAEEGARYEHRVVSIEHVLPQSPPGSSQWVEVVPKPRGA